MSAYPALDVHGADGELALAVVDDFSPVAAQDLPAGLTLYFATALDRDRARDALIASLPGVVVTAREVDDEDWARRSQEGLEPVTVGRVTILPALPAHRVHVLPEGPAIPFDASGPLDLVIVPSMGFGTGHHATTRLCLAALQEIDLAETFVLDVGTGSGVLALAARLLGARSALGLDIDQDAIDAAMDNLRDNPGIHGVRFATGNLETMLEAGELIGTADVVTANLTGALVMKSARLLVRALRPGGRLIVSGVLDAEATAVQAALESHARLVSVTSEDEWVGLILEKTVTANSTG